MTGLLASRSEQLVAWRDASTGYEADVNGERWAIEIGDFPDERLYSLKVDGKAVGSFDQWPAAWSRPQGHPIDQRQRVEALRAEIARIEA